MSVNNRNSESKSGAVVVCDLVMKRIAGWEIYHGTVISFKIL